MFLDFDLMVVVFFVLEGTDFPLLLGLGRTGRGEERISLMVASAPSDGTGDGVRSDDSIGSDSNGVYMLDADGTLSEGSYSITMSSSSSSSSLMKGADGDGSSITTSTEGLMIGDVGVKSEGGGVKVTRGKDGDS